MTNYLNLTSGLEWLNVNNETFNSEEPYKLVRIQSSQLEAGKLWSIILDLDYQFLFDAAIGEVKLFDCGSRSGETSRAQWYGVPWIKWAYAKANGGTLEKPITRNTNATTHFENFYSYGESDSFRKRAKNKMRYVSKLTGSKQLIIDNISMVSTMDGQTEELAKLAKFRK